MGFGGGGGSDGTKAHVHTNASGQGGALDSTSLLNSSTLASQISGMSLVLDESITGSNTSPIESSTFDAYDNLLVYIKLLGNNTSSSHHLRFNSDATGIYNQIRVINDTYSSAVSQTGILLGNINLTSSVWQQSEIYIKNRTDAEKLVFWKTMDIAGDQTAIPNYNYGGGKYVSNDRVTSLEFVKTGTYGSDGMVLRIYGWNDAT